MRGFSERGQGHVDEQCQISLGLVDLEKVMIEGQREAHQELPTNQA